jgi:hypothetical protein
VALSVHGFVDFNFRIPSNALLFAVLLGSSHRGSEALLGRRGSSSFGRARPRRPAPAGAVWTLRLGWSDELNRRVNLSSPGPRSSPP